MNEGVHLGYYTQMGAFVVLFRNHVKTTGREKLK